MRTGTRAPRGAPLPAQLPVSRQRRLTSIELMNGGREIVIEHAGCEYRLRVTSQNKLILTK
jgi:hemin uptake protein HemP